MLIDHTPLGVLADYIFSLLTQTVFDCSYAKQGHTPLTRTRKDVVIILGASRDRPEMSGSDIRNLIATIFNQ
jgi:hypothetical protein